MNENITLDKKKGCKTLKHVSIGDKFNKFVHLK